MLSSRGVLRGLKESLSMNGRVDHPKQWACLMKSSSVNDNAVASETNRAENLVENYEPS